MANARKAKSKAVEEGSKALDRIFQEVDPQAILAASLGGTAAYYGITPPLTRILMATSGNSDVVSQDLTKIALDYAAYFTISPVGSVIDFLTGAFIPWGGQAGSASDLSVQDLTTEQKARNAQRAMFASGALEALIVYTFVSRPENVKMVMETMKELGSGLAGLAKTVPIP